jgi:hypothetical protein
MSDSITFKLCGEHRAAVSPAHFHVPLSTFCAETNSTKTVLNSRQVDLPVVTYNDPCGDYDRGTLQRGMLCAGQMRGGKDTCQVIVVTGFSPVSIFDFVLITTILNHVVAFCDAVGYCLQYANVIRC